MPTKKLSNKLGSKGMLKVNFAYLSSFNYDGYNIMAG